MSQGGPITVVARWQMAPASVDTVLALIVDLRRGTLAEPGCVGYDVFRSADNPGELLLLERYKDAAAIDAHRAAPHYKELVVQKIIPLLTDRKVDLLEAVSAT